MVYMGFHMDGMDILQNVKLFEGETFVGKTFVGKNFRGERLSWGITFVGAQLFAVSTHESYYVQGSKSIRNSYSKSLRESNS